MILGLTGPVQNGKIQLAHVFEEYGWKFHDLNDVIYANREKGSERHTAYQTLIPGCLDDEGVETAAFYRGMDPKLYRLFLMADLPVVFEAACRICGAARKQKENAVVSWEYLSKFAGRLSLDGLVIFGSNRRTWFDRMKARAAELGWNDPSDEALESIVRMLDVEPATIDHEARSGFPNDLITRIDVSGDDWGASELRKFLGALG